MRLINGSECAFIIGFNKTCYVPLKSSKHVYVVGSHKTGSSQDKLVSRNVRMGLLCNENYQTSYMCLLIEELFVISDAIFKLEVIILAIYRNNSQFSYIKIGCLNLIGPIFTR